MKIWGVINNRLFVLPQYWAKLTQLRFFYVIGKKMISFHINCRIKQKNNIHKNKSPTVGLEPTTTRLRALRSTN